MSGSELAGAIDAATDVSGSELAGAVDATTDVRGSELAGANAAVEDEGEEDGAGDVDPAGGVPDEEKDGSEEKENCQRRTDEKSEKIITLPTEGAVQEPREHGCEKKPLVERDVMSRLGTAEKRSPKQEAENELRVQIIMKELHELGGCEPIAAPACVEPPLGSQAAISSGSEEGEGETREEMKRPMHRKWVGALMGGKPGSGTDTP